MELRRILFVTIFCCFLFSTHAQFDRTRMPDTSGSTLVEAALAQLHDACIYPDDYLFLRRLAYVETRDGTDPATYTTPGYNGGIWKIDEDMFRRTQTEAARLAQQYKDIQDKLGIDWRTVTWADMRRPLYSALAAAMLLTLEGGPDNVPKGTDAQAAYWLSHYRQHHTTQTVQTFTGPVQQLEQTCSRTEDLDIVFLIDTSSSVGPSEWEAEKKFVSDIIINLSLHNGLGPTKDRVAMITYSDDARLAFDFNLGSDLMTALAQVNNAPNLPGSSNIASALNMAQSQVLAQARPEAAKVIVLVTDGRADDRVQMVLAAMPLKLTDVTIYTIGVGRQADPAELAQVASTPSCSHTFHVATHQDLDDLRLAIEQISCRVPVVLAAGQQYTYPCGYNVLAQLQGGSVGTSVTVTTDFGKLEVWGSYNTQLPGRDVHDLNFTAAPSSPAVVFSRDQRPLTLSLETEHANGMLCHGNFTIKVDSQAAKRSDCNNRLPDLVFLLDETLAPTDAHWDAMLDFVTNFVQQFQVGPNAAQVALVSFSDRQTTYFRFGQLFDTAMVLQVVRGIARPQGTTSDLPAALNYVANQILTPLAGARANASKTVILVTRGAPTDPLNAVGQAAALHMLGTRIVTVAVGNSFDDVNLNAISSGPQHVEKISDVMGMTSLASRVIDEACGVVKVVCVEGGVQRECSIEDLIASQYGNMLGPDRTAPSNPCALQMATGTFQIDRFPHPTDTDKFLLCDSNGQAYVVLCPPGELYSPAAHECRPVGVVLPFNGMLTFPTTTPTTTTTTPTTTTKKTTIRPTMAPTRAPYAVPRLRPTATPTSTTSTTTTASTTPNPCTPAAIQQQEMYHPDPLDKTQYIHCDRNGVAKVEKCDPGKEWYQHIKDCIFPYVIVDKNTNAVDPSLPNPCLGGPGFFPAPVKNNMYIECNQYHEGYLMKCPPGQVWKHIFYACDMP